MFTTPIKRTRLKSFEEVVKFSLLTGFRSTPLTKRQEGRQIAFTGQNSYVYVTPYRGEIHTILEEAGYKDDPSMFVPFSNNQNRSADYEWLEKIAKEETWAQTHEEAYKIASKKGIRPVTVDTKGYQIKEVLFYPDPDTQNDYHALTMEFLPKGCEENIGTYIIVDQKTIVICDEYGRTFLVKAKTIINDLVNLLLDAGYTRTVHPEWYIKPF